MRQAEELVIEALQKVVRHTTDHSFPTQNLFRLAKKKTTFNRSILACRMTCCIKASKGVTRPDGPPGLINLDSC